MIKCSLAGKCAGCQWIEMSYPDQLAAKKRNLVEAWVAAGLLPQLLGEFPVHSIGETGNRERADLVLSANSERKSLGMYLLNDRTEILDMPACPALSSPLEAWFLEFRNFLTSVPDIKKGSLRLRIAPDGTRGVWFDFSNEDIKKLLEERNWLTQVQEKAIVEIGQKRKRLIEKNGKLGLGDPELYPWSFTVSNGNRVPLYTSIAGFTQSGTPANIKIAETLLSFLPKDLSGDWVELGSGSGTLTLPLLGAGVSLTAIEQEPIAVDGLLRSAQESTLAQNLSIFRASFHHPSELLKSHIQNKTGVIADPPRSGLKGFLDVMETLPTMERPQHFLYVSCWEDSFAADSARLLQLGYHLKQIAGVDQYPQTSHCEYLAGFTKQF